MINSTPNIPVGKWIKCDACGEILYKEHIRQNLSVCTNCGNHFRLSARRRIKQIIDEETFEEFDADNEKNVQTNEQIISENEVKGEVDNGICNTSKSVSRGL